MKVLVSGAVGGKYKALFDKVSRINAGKAGPFDVLFCVGPFSSERNNDEIIDYIKNPETSEIKPPISTYFCDAGPASDIFNVVESEDSIHEVAPLLYYLGTGGIKTVQKLTVAFLSSKTIQNDIDIIKRIGKMAGYRGADFLLSTEWPRGFDSNLSESVIKQLLDDGLCASIAGNELCSEVAQIVRPRYHFSSGEGLYFQRVPYSNTFIKSDGKAQNITTRFIGLGFCSSDSTNKKLKWLHAINVEPISFMTDNTLDEIPEGSTQNPYIAKKEISRNVKRQIISQSPANEKKSKPNEDETLQKEMIIPSWVDQAQSETKNVDSGVFIWGDQSKQKKKMDNETPDPSNTAVFIGNIVPSTNKFEIENLLLSTGFNTSCIKEIITLNKEFAFVEFTSHDIAAKAIETLNHSIKFKNKLLSCNWRKKFIVAQTTDLSLSAKKVPSEGNIVRKTKCWFCLANDEVEQHLLVTIGEESYVALAKGPIVPLHVLIVPISHVSRYSELSEKCTTEIEMLKDALRKFYVSKNCEVFLFERCVDTVGTNHMHIQVVPIPTGPQARATWNLLNEEGERHRMNFTEVDSTMNLRRILETGQYFYTEIPGEVEGSVVKLLFNSETVGRTIHMQLGRNVAAKILSMPERADWKRCEVSKAEETALCESFKKQFEQFNPI